MTPAARAQARIDAFVAEGRGQAKSLIVTVFGDALLPRGGRIWLGSLARLMAPLGLNERLIRTTLSRLVQDHWLTVIAEGRRSDYALSPTGRVRFEEASTQIYARQAPAWDGRWRILLHVGELAGPDREALRRALFWHGFGQLGPRDYVHPSADLRTVLTHLNEEDLGSLAPQLLPLEGQRILPAQATQMSASDADLVARAWNLDELADRYRSFVDQYQPFADPLGSTGESQRISAATAFQLRTLLIHDYRRLLLRDPQLPPELLPTDWPGTIARDLTAQLYAQWLDASERHLDAEMTKADGSTPSASGNLKDRFVRLSRTT